MVQLASGKDSNLANSLVHTGKHKLRSKTDVKFTALSASRL